MAKYQVIAEFVDKETGVRIQPGTAFEASGKRVKELQEAGVIGDEVKPGPAKKAGD